MTKKLSGACTNRKRSNKAVGKAVVIDNLTPVTQNEANLFQGLIQISNNYGKLKKQQAEYDMVLRSLKDKRKAVTKGEIELPIMMPFGKNKFYQCNDIKYVLKEIDSEIGILSNASKGIEGQVTQHKDAFVEQGLAIADYAANKFGKYKPENVYSKGCNPKKDETILFEGEMEDMLKNKHTKAEFQKAVAKANKLNKSK